MDLQLTLQDSFGVAFARFAATSNFFFVATFGSTCACVPATSHVMIKSCLAVNFGPHPTRVLGVTEDLASLVEGDWALALSVVCCSIWLAAAPARSQGEVMLGRICELCKTGIAEGEGKAVCTVVMYYCIRYF